jgi:hypothetical protein
MLDPYAETELGFGSCSLGFSRWGGVEVDFFCAGSLQKSASAFDFFRSSARNQQELCALQRSNDPGHYRSRGDDWANAGNKQKRRTEQQPP